MNNVIASAERLSGLASKAAELGQGIVNGMVVKELDPLIPCPVHAYYTSSKINTKVEAVTFEDFVAKILALVKPYPYQGYNTSVHSVTQTTSGYSAVVSRYASCD